MTINRFGFESDQDPISTFFHAQCRYSIGPVESVLDRDHEDARDALLSTLWCAYDASTTLVVRHGDEVSTLCLWSEVALQDRVLRLGGLTIDLDVADMAFGACPKAGMNFVLDGVPLRLAHHGNIIDMSYHFALEMATQVIRMWRGEIDRIDVVRGDRSGSFGRDDVRLYSTRRGRYAIRFGNLLLVRANQGTVRLLDDGVSDGIDLDGVPVRIAVIPAEGHTVTGPSPDVFDWNYPHEPVAKVVPIRTVEARSVAPRRGLGTSSVPQDAIARSTPSASTLPRRGLGRRSDTIAA